MKFSIVIGNPPYQMSDGGGGVGSATPIYNIFIEQAVKIANHVSMIIPARWYNGGKSLDVFRQLMFYNVNMVELYDFEDWSVFSNVKIPGGLCYFHIDNTKPKDKCIVHSFNKLDNGGCVSRNLMLPWCDTFVRRNKAYTIINNMCEPEDNFSRIVHARNIYNLESNLFTNKDRINKLGISKEKTEINNIKIYGVVNNKRECRYISNSKLLSNKGLTAVEMDTISMYKVFLSKAVDSNVQNHLFMPFLGYPNEIATETYLTIGPFLTKEEAECCIDYIHSKLFHFLVLNRLSSQNITSKQFSLVPNIDYKHYSIEHLIEELQLSTDDLAYIESSIRNRK